MTLCKDCKHCVHFARHECAALWKCNAIKMVSPVNGLETPANCGLERLSINGKCGPDGKLFEAVDRENLA